MKLKKYIALIVMLVLLTACSTGGGNDAGGDSGKPVGSNGNSPSQNNSDAQSADQDGYAQKFKITAMKYAYGELPPNNGPGIQMINERFNIDYQVEQVPVASYNEKLSAVFASGSIPDMIAFTAPDLKNRYQKFAKQGAFLALDDYIDDYPSLKMVPDFVWDQFRVDGKIYGIPKYYPRFSFLPMIRKDWLDNLGLEVPTNYEELKEVALAFTNDDPNQNGKKDTYGIAFGKDFNPTYSVGAYWDPHAWYHQDEAGLYIPGIISDAHKETVAMFAELYQAGALTRDFASLDWALTNKEFYSGKAGIFIGTPRGMVQAYSDSLLELDPKAEFTFMAPAVAPDGSQGLASSSGFIGFVTLSAEAGKDEAKVRRMLDLLELPRTVIPVEENNPANADFDFLLGGEGKAYDMVDGKPVPKQDAHTSGLRPTAYVLDDVPWPEKESDKVYVYSNPVLNDVVQEMLAVHGKSQFYGSPHFAANSPTLDTQGEELQQYLLNEQSKMIAGQRPISEWDHMVEEWKAKGGAKIIEEVNASVMHQDPSTAWE